ncbi:sulfate adenylyltransferase subunit 2 [Lentzea fradiae]|uniref:Sulfate adenylyltransferase subunit 2 n=1 Tax=Lentzea fradiae TaxID=200378 RepID=A0A1G7NXA7_9PSEU|nr:sulfate adenylyltransferase subunit 2 [Lentzea fradiae]
MPMLKADTANDTASSPPSPAAWKSAACTAGTNDQAPSLYFAHSREVYLRDGMWLTAGPWGGPAEGEETVEKTVRYRTVGDGSCTGAVESDAATVGDIIEEIKASRLTERGASRADDRMSEAAMEDRKREGYF